MPSTDPLQLAQALIRCASITPADDRAQGVLADALAGLGFTVHHVPFGSTPNLVATIGSGRPHLCFAGHTDVVPPGDGWTHAPFDAVIAACPAGEGHAGAAAGTPGGEGGGDVTGAGQGHGDRALYGQSHADTALYGQGHADTALYGRGACDMKGAIAAFAAAAAAFGPPARGTISLLITGDEEGPALDGTVRVLGWMAARGLTPDFCIVGEPTNPTRLGEVIKIGRRGSLNATLRIHGVQGHAAYPHLADNPVHRLVAALSALTGHRLDNGTEWFEPSSLQVTSVDVGNTAGNVIPAAAVARFNIRFNDSHTGAGLEAWLRHSIAPFAPRFDLEVAVSGEAFLTAPSDFTSALSRAVEHVTGITPRLDTGGGTSDARFISRVCPVAEFGLVGASMHRIDEHVPLADLTALTEIYADLLRRVLG
jgi:succinyl-diaminopimelate desuccinylase